jgi:hypothetical protein
MPSERSRTASIGFEISPQLLDSIHRTTIPRWIVRHNIKEARQRSSWARGGTLRVGLLDPGRRPVRMVHRDAGVARGPAEWMNDPEGFPAFSRATRPVCAVRRAVGPHRIGSQGARYHRRWHLFSRCATPRHPDGRAGHGRDPRRPYPFRWFRRKGFTSTRCAPRSVVRRAARAANGRRGGSSGSAGAFPQPRKPRAQLGETPCPW